ncbi:MAG: hypothetical protein ACYCQK_01735 [Acidiferrobacteraceae bacterium]
MTASAWQLAADLLDPPVRGAAIYHADPGGFVTDCIRWKDLPAHHGPTRYQLDNLRRLARRRRLAVRGPHGLGKTTGSAWAILWFALTRDAAGQDWKIPTTASAWRQLEKFLWPEVHKWARLLDWDRIGRPPFRRDELLRLAIKLETGEAFAAASDDAAKLEGAHADQLLFIFDESKTIPEATFDAAEGAFSGGGGDTAQEAYALASSTPGAPMGRFYDIHKRKPGLEDWDVVHVTLDETVSAGRVSREWAEQRARQWGSSSAVFLNRVKGKFAASDEDSVIPLAWIELANERWLALASDEEIAARAPYAMASQDDQADPLDAVGVDVARSGADKTILALRYGLAIREIRRFSKQGTMDTAGRVLGVLATNPWPSRTVSAIVDVIGIGAGVVDRLRETTTEQVVPFNASERSTRKDRSGELGFVNCRAAGWWNLREMLDPDSGLEVALPPDDLLTGDLTAPTWRVMSGGRIQVESKDDIRKRLGRSTDDGDAVVMAFWPESGVSKAVEMFAGDPNASMWAQPPQPSRWEF